MILCSLFHHLNLKTKRTILIFWTEYVSFSSCGTRSSSSFKLKHMSSKCNRQLHSYFFRLPRIWNSLPPIDPYTVSFSTIKSRITSHLIDHFLENFDSDNPCTYHYTCPCHKCSKTPVNLHYWYFGFRLFNHLIIVNSIRVSIQVMDIPSEL